MAEQTFEIVVYTAKEPEIFRAQQQKLHSLLPPPFDGYMASLALCGLDGSDRFADVVLWADMESALRASETLQHRTDLHWLISAIESVVHMEHVTADNTAMSGLQKLSGAPVVEIVLAKPAHSGTFDEAHQMLHSQYLQTRPDVIVSLRLARNSNGTAGDLIGWKDHDSFTKTGETLMKVAELAPIFDEDNQPLVFDTFSVNNEAT